MFEDRVLPSIFTVTNTADTGMGSLRDAITQSNNTAGSNIIDFNISGSGVHWSAFDPAEIGIACNHQ